MFTQDKDLRYIWVGGDYFGCDAEAAVGKDDAALLPPELVAPMLALKTARSSRPASRRASDMPYQRDGKTHWCNIHVEPWRSRQGVVRSLLGAVSDVTGPQGDRAAHPHAF